MASNPTSPGSTRPSSSSTKGSMTAVMRAATLGPKVLRIGLFDGKRLVDERVHQEKARVTLGATEKHDWIVPGALGMTLFEPTNEGYILQLSKGMRGKFVMAGATVDVEEATSRSSTPLLRVALKEDARGRLQLGDAMLLFQFVQAPPKASKPQLPKGVLQRGQQDWTMTILAACSFLAHFGAVGSLYSDWGDRVMSDEASVAGLVDTLQHRPKPPIAETPMVTQPDSAKPTDAKTDPVAAATGRRVETGRPSGPAGHAAGAKSDTASLIAQIERMDAGTVAFFDTSKPATQGVLRDSNIPTGNMDGLAKSEQGVGPGADLHVATGPGIDTGAKRGIGDIGSDKKSSTNGEDSGTRSAMAKPTGVVGGGVAPSKPGPGHVPGADGTIAGAKGRVRSCYNNQGLSTNPDMQGSVSFTLAIGASGAVSSVSASPGGSISPAVTGCIRNILSGLVFAAPEGGAAVVSGSFTFINGSKR